MKSSLTESVYRAMFGTVGMLPVETGGMFGSSDGETIDHFHFDECAATSGITYRPSVEILNKYVVPDWKSKGVEVIGFVHSHPRGHCRPSLDDEVYAAAIMTANDLNRLYLPILQSADDGCFLANSYWAEMYRGKVRIVDAPIRIVPDAHNVLADTYAEAPTFHSRVEDVYPLEIMRRKTLVCIGCGGAGEYVEHIARTGIGTIIIIDGDTYSETNLATQQCYCGDLGANKALVTAYRLFGLNPETQVKTVQRFLDDDFADKEFEGLVGPALFECPEDILIAACTDNFFAQDRAMRLSLKYGTPYLAAGIYDRGLAAEVVFSYPGVTPACPRCILTTRYHAYLREGYENQVGSQNCPIFATQRLNALKGYVSLMLLLYKESGPFAGLLDEVADRNILQIRLSPDPSSPVHPLFRKHLGASPYTFFDETLWITVTPEDDCPDCQGCGDLSLLRGAVADSRDIPLGGAVYEG
jgi:proteasome lid subunit RPN8/RPN11